MATSLRECARVGCWPPVRACCGLEQKSPPARHWEEPEQGGLAEEEPAVEAGVVARQWEGAAAVRRWVVEEAVRRWVVEEAVRRWAEGGAEHVLR